MNESDQARGLHPPEATLCSTASPPDNFDSKLAILVARFGLDSTLGGG
jgi:hypothetical protein